MNEFENLKASVNSIFDDIAIAEKVIAKYSVKGITYKTKLDKNFMLFMRSEYITTNYLYEKHCEDIAWRIVKDQDTRPATNAELLNLTSSASSQAKFNGDGVLVFDYLFGQVTGKPSPAHGIYPQPYQGYTQKLVEEIRKKYTISTRSLVL